MEKEFVSYRLTRKLHELGFNTSFIGYSFKKFNCEGVSNAYVELVVPNHVYEHYSLLEKAILYQQVFDWFREEHHILGAVYSSGSGYEWEFHYDKTRGGTSVKMSWEDGDCELSGAYTTYEKAREDLIKNMIKYINK